MVNLSGSMASQFRSTFVNLPLIVLLWLFSSGSPATQSAKCQLNVGWESWIPFQYIDHNGDLTGLDIDLTRAIFKGMDCQLTFVNMPWPRQKLALKNNTIDVVMSMVKNQEGLDIALMGDSYHDINYQVFIAKSQLKKYPKLTNLEDIASTSLRIGVVTINGYQPSYEKRLYSSLLARNMIMLRNDIAVLHGLDKGRLDGFLVNQEFAHYHLSQRSLMAQYVAVKAVSPPKDLSYIALSPRIATKEFIVKFNRTLAKLRANGEHQTIVNKYNDIAPKLSLSQ